MKSTLYPHQFLGKPPLTALILHPHQQNEILKKCIKSWLFEECSGGRVLWISSDKDDWRTFLGLKFFIQGFFWVAWFKYWLFWFSFKKILRFMVVPAYPGHIVLVMDFSNVLSFCVISFYFESFLEFFEGSEINHWIFLGFAIQFSTWLCNSSIKTLLPFDHPRYFWSGLSPWGRVSHQKRKFACLLLTT